MRATQLVGVTELHADRQHVANAGITLHHLFHLKDQHAQSEPESRVSLDFHFGSFFMDSSKETTKLWRVFRTVKELVRDRGYNVGASEVEISLEDFKAEFCTPDGSVIRGKMNFQAMPMPETTEKFPHLGSLWVNFCEEASVGVKTMRDFVVLVATKHFSNALFIYQQSVTPAAQKLIPTVAPAVIETFQESDLVVNITKHVLVPKHIVLNEGEKKELLSKYRLKESQLPRIQGLDPVARYLGLKRGQVVKIIRRSETSGRYASYRICL